MAEPLLFDPRVEELLWEIAADPQSSLLRVPRPARLGVVLERKPLVGLATAGLSTAERELVRVHRSAVAMSLRELARIRLFESPLAVVCRTRTNSSRRDEFSSARDAWLTGSQDLSSRPGSRAEPLEPFALLDQCLERSDAIDSTSVSALAAAANLLDPTDQARIFAAQSIAEGDGRADAERVLLDVLSGVCSSANRAAAQANLGWIALQLERTSDACDWYAQAARTRPDIGPAVLGWLWAAVESAKDAQSMEAAAWADAHVGPGAACVQEFIALTGAQLRGNRLTGSADRRARWERLTTRTGATVRTLALALTGMV